MILINDSQAYLDLHSELFWERGRAVAWAHRKEFNMDRTVNRAGCLAKGVAHGGRVGHELILLAKRAHTEGRITDEDWQKLPSTPEGMVNLLLGHDGESINRIGGFTSFCF